MKFKRLIPALAMLLVSAILLGTSTFAWFSMNTQVTATNMKVKAVAEDGIVISNTLKTSWTNTADAQVTTAELVPTSAATLASPAWVHAASVAADDADQNQALTGSKGYTDLTLSWNYNATEGIGYTENGTNTAYDVGTDTPYVLLNNFFIKSSGDVITNTLYINDLTVEGATNKIDAALRVLIVVNGTDAFTFAPVGATNGGAAPSTGYKWKATTTVNPLTGTDAQDVQCTSVTSIGNTNDTAINVKVYMYFEGEDVNCKSTNISGITTTDLSLTVKFGLQPTHA